MSLQLFLCVVVILNLHLKSATLIKLGDYSFNIRESSQLVEVYTSISLKKFLLDSIKNLPKRESMEELQLIQNSCPNHIGLLEVPIAENHHTISLIIVINSSFESSIHICRKENETRLVSFTKESNLGKLKMYTDVLEAISANKIYRKPLKTQILVLSSNFEILQIKFQEDHDEKRTTCTSNCIDCLDNGTCNVCNFGFYLDYFGNCEACRRSCKICDSSKICTSSIQT